MNMIVLLLHVRSENLDVSLVRLNKEHKTDVFLIRQIPLHGNIRSYIDEASILLAKTKEKIEKIFCVLNSPFFTSSTKVLSHKEKNIFKVTNNLIQTITAGDEKELIEREVLHINVNGYSTSNAIGKEANELEIVIYESIAHKEVLRELEENIINTSKRVQFHTFPFIAHKFNLEKLKNNNPFLLIQVEKDITTLTKVASNSSVESSNIDIGYSNIFSEIKRVLSVDENVAISILKMIKEGVVEQSLKEKIIPILLDESSRWGSEILKSIDILSLGLPVKQDLYIEATHLWIDFFIQEMKRRDKEPLDYKELISEINFENIPEYPFSTLINVLFIKNLYL
jgi:hypothetical protein